MSIKKKKKIFSTSFFFFSNISTSPTPLTTMTFFFKSTIIFFSDHLHISAIGGTLFESFKIPPKKLTDGETGATYEFTWNGFIEKKI